ncbi:MAG TPA: hypothetical protein VGL88_14015 [Pseudonocardiaceae bacterium]
MATMRHFVGVVVFCSAIVLASCSATDAGQSPGSNVTSTTSAVPAPAPTDAAGLAALLRRGISSVSSAHLTLNVSAGSKVIKGEGDAKLADGTLQALGISEELGSTGTLRLVVADGATYALLPPTLNPSGNYWVLVIPNSSNPAVRTLATVIESFRSSASFDNFTAFTSAARRVTLVGNESLDGAPVTHYSIDVDVAKLPNTIPGRQALLGAGVTTLPTELYVDGDGRPVKLTQDLTLQGQRFSTVITLSKFNAPVSISAPPADQIGPS